MYDVIGDIHGHADELVELLTKLGYSQTTDCFRHPQSRKVVFCGDFIDRGPHIPDVVRIAKSMVEGDAALAVMGNHEFNALAFHTPDPASPDDYLRVHNKKNIQQHSHTQNQFCAEELEESLNWFRTLPAAIDLGELRIVHACWHTTDIQVIEDYSKKCGAFTPAFLKHATTKGSTLFKAIERVMKGPELPLPDGMTVEDKEGNTRHRIRIRWFDSPNRHTWATYSLPIKSHLPQTPVPVNAPAVPYADDEPPLFVGHYWLPDDEPAPLKPNIACLDYSVAKHGMMCAYRFDGGTVLSKDRFVTVKSNDCGDTA